MEEEKQRGKVVDIFGGEGSQLRCLGREERCSDQIDKGVEYSSITKTAYHIPHSSEGLWRQ